MRPAEFVQGDVSDMTTPSPAAPSRQTVEQLLARTTAKLTGRERGPDPQVRRLSYDVDDDRAKPWKPIGDGTAGHGLAFAEALVQTADELRRDEWEKRRAGEAFTASIEAGSATMTIRVAGDAVFAAGMIVRGAGIAAGTRVKAVHRSRLGQLVELTQPACASAEGAELRLYLDRLRRVDVTVLQALLAHLDFRTGRLFPTMETIAVVAACSVRTVANALRRLVERGFIDRIRRSRATGNEGSFAPQREQTSNAYFFDHRRAMAARVWARFQQRLVAKLKRLTAHRPPPPPSSPPRRDVRDRALAASLERLGSAIAARAAT